LRLEAIAQRASQPEVLFGGEATSATGDDVLDMKLRTAHILAGQTVAAAIACCDFDAAAKFRETKVIGV